MCCYLGVAEPQPGYLSSGAYSYHQWMTADPRDGEQSYNPGGYAHHASYHRVPDPANELDAAYSLAIDFSHTIGYQGLVAELENHNDIANKVTSISEVKNVSQCDTEVHSSTKRIYLAARLWDPSIRKRPGMQRFNEAIVSP